MLFGRDGQLSILCSDKGTWVPVNLEKYMQLWLFSVFHLFVSWKAVSRISLALLFHESVVWVPSIKWEKQCTVLKLWICLRS